MNKTCPLFMFGEERKKIHSDTAPLTSLNNMEAFQAEYAGSIPATRSTFSRTIFHVQNTLILPRFSSRARCNRMR